MDKTTKKLENVEKGKYFEAYQDGLGRTTQTLDHVVVVHRLI